MNIKVILKSLNIKSLDRFLNFVLVLSLVLLGDILLIVFLSVYWHTYLILAILCFLTFLSFIISKAILKKSLSNLNLGLKSGVIPEKEFSMLFGNMVGAVFFIIPGFISFIIGAFLLYNIFSKKVGDKLIYYFDLNITELYEYIKLYELEI